MLTRVPLRLDSEPDPLFPASAHFGLGTAFDRVEVETARPSLRRPLGMRYVVDAAPVEVDYSAVRYDPMSQVAMITTEGVPVPLAKHTTGPTNTKTSDGHRGMDSDADQRED